MGSIDSVLGGIQFGTLIYWGILIFGIGFALFTVSLTGLCSIMVYRLYNRTSGCNCLYWKHADNTKEGVDYMELKRIYLDEDLFVKHYFIKMGWPLARGLYEAKPKTLFSKARESMVPLYETRLKNAAQAYVEQRKLYPDHAQDWDYKETWWQLWRVTVKWVYEEKQQDGSFLIRDFEPDKVIQDYLVSGYPCETSREIAEDLRCSQNWLVLYKKPLKWLQTLALGAPAVLGIAFVFGIVILGVFLIGEAD